MKLWLKIRNMIWTVSFVTARLETLYSNSSKYVLSLLFDNYYK